MQLDTRRPPILKDEWHTTILVSLGAVLCWNLVAAWFSVQPDGGELPTQLQMRAMHFRVFLPAMVFAVVSLALGVGRARRGGTLAGYGLAAVGVMMVTVVVLFATFMIRTAG